MHNGQLHCIQSDFFFLEKKNDIHSFKLIEYIGYKHH